MLTEAEVELTKQVTDLFKSNYEHGPWPTEAECYPVAVMINIVRQSKKYEENLKKENVRLRQRRAVVEATRRLIDDQKQFFKSHLDTFAPLRLHGWVEQLANLEAAEAALERATPALLAPFDPMAGERDKAWWHKAAFMIAQRARTALEESGHPRVSYQKHGEFVVVVAAALKLAGIKCAPTTVATVLAKQTNNSAEIPG
jgi:hypothetical protein